jgi:hypothetical protein
MVQLMAMLLFVGIIQTYGKIVKYLCLIHMFAIKNIFSFFNHVIHTKKKKEVMESLMTECPYCFNTALESNGTSIICSNCGGVVSEDHLISALAFEKTASGASSILGWSVPSMGLESTRATIQKATKRMKEIASQLNLGSDIVAHAGRVIETVGTKFMQGF